MRAVHVMLTAELTRLNSNLFLAEFLNKIEGIKQPLVEASWSRKQYHSENMRLLCLFVSSGSQRHYLDEVGKETSFWLPIQ